MFWVFFHANHSFNIVDVNACFRTCNWILYGVRKKMYSSMNVPNDKREIMHSFWTRHIHTATVWPFNNWSRKYHMVVRCLSVSLTPFWHALILCEVSLHIMCKGSFFTNFQNQLTHTVTNEIDMDFKIFGFSGSRISQKTNFSGFLLSTFKWVRLQIGWFNSTVENLKFCTIAYRAAAIHNQYQMFQLQRSLRT